MAPAETSARGHGFGTAPVFLAAVSTILGAILFLRFGYAVGHVGLLGALLIVLISHIITIPTGLAVAEIATNLKVEGGGEYYIVSRSFGATVGGAIGISLYLSQAISIAFYLIAFAEAFRPLFGLAEQHIGFAPDPRMISVPAALALAAIIARKGANLGVGVLWFVVAVLAVSLGFFFAGAPTAAAPLELLPSSHVAGNHAFFVVFAVIFPAFTGMTAGVGLSGDLRNPRRSIPLGTLLGTLVGMVVYVLVSIKLSLSASPTELAEDQFIMSRIALWGPIIPIGLAAATISSSIGSILVAPRTLQALAADKILPSLRLNRLLARGRGESGDPANATWLTAVIVLGFVSVGNVDFVAKIISMFFMITYGALCTISFLEHFAGNPSYRPTFHTRWYLSLLGAVASFVMMFLMQTLYAAVAVAAMIALYSWLRHSRKGERDLAAVVKGVLFQLTRRLQVMIQKQQAAADLSSWRPSVVAVSRHSADRLAPFDLLRWISHYYGFGSYLHFIEGPLTYQSNMDAQKVRRQLVAQTQASGAGLYVDTLVSPSFKTAVAQIVQMPGVAGMENNTILFEFAKDEAEDLADIVESSRFAAYAGHNICVLRSSERHFGYRRSLHIWLNAGDLRNANLMILLAYVLVGHPDWRGCEIQLLAAFDPERVDEAAARLTELVTAGRIPISAANVQRVTLESGVSFEEMVSQRSGGADLVITGLSLKKMVRDKGHFLAGIPGVHDVLFVHTGQSMLIAAEEGDGNFAELLDAEDSLLRQEPKIAAPDEDEAEAGDGEAAPAEDGQESSSVS